MKGIEYIIWDWNGTLLNDVESCIVAMNKLLTRRNLPNINIDTYRKIFGFPVQAYYEKLGFDFQKESFDIPAMEFIDEYMKLVPHCPLFQDSIELLNWFDQNNYKQLILSAMEHEKLNELLIQKNIKRYFNNVAGLNHDYATSKIEIGYELIYEEGILPSLCCIIGDTTHDYEVANALGCECVLVCQGHQSKERLQKTGAPVLNNLWELKDFICERINVR